MQAGETGAFLNLYDATGKKLRYQPERNHAIVKTTDYIGNFVYEDNQLKYILTAEGRIVPKAEGGYDYQYFLKDHLGSTRVLFNSAGSLGVDSYYPFGMLMEGFGGRQSPDNENKYLYNGKELQDDFRLDWYDYGARFYDAVLGRFHTLDRFAEDFSSWSPYHYANNNAIRNIDINGDSTFVTANDNGTYTVTGGNLDNEEDKGVYMMGEDGAYTQVGESLTTNSFFDDNGNAVTGAVIDPNSSEGTEFIMDLVMDDPSLPEYMVNATNDEKYDFKTEGLDKRPEGIFEQQHKYRGSAARDGVFGSARDFGNIGAGIVAGRNGLSWGEA